MVITYTSEFPAAALIDFLYQLIEALERHYDGLLINRNRSHQREPSCPAEPAGTSADDPPF